jgi:type III pantothenate kinase
MTSLARATAQLPTVSLEAPPCAIGTNTVHAIQSGIVLGYKGLVESMITQFKTEMTTTDPTSENRITVIATGGLNSVLRPLTTVFQYVDRQLILFGMRRIAELVTRQNT